MGDPHNHDSRNDLPTGATLGITKKKDIPKILAMANAPYTGEHIRVIYTRPVACNCGLVSMNYGLLWGIAACDLEFWATWLSRYCILRPCACQLMGALGTAHLVRREPRIERLLAEEEARVRALEAALRGARPRLSTSCRVV